MRSEEYSQPFTTIAPYYDTLMSFVNYPAWVEYIERILALYERNDRLIFDLACGTGVCLELWYERGYQVLGLDRSFTMLEVCRNRLQKKKGESVALINGDMRWLALHRVYPVITCLYDSLNYLLKEEELAACFKNVHRTLSEKGLFIFDMNTIRCLRDEWGNNTYYRQDENINSVWSNQFDVKNSISSLELVLKIKQNGDYHTIREFHQERGYPLSTIARLLTRAGFTFSLYRHLTFNPAWEQDLRIMGVAEKC
ncbi:class I SAM-dependent methyltransferase [candidate division WOR-3 bacterium]|nr:class I SAM-dependent methyltransferase [candidate division WOR-3 bacterium]